MTHTASPRIGVFLCTCDGRINKSIAVDALPYVLRANREVVNVSVLDHVCLPDGLRTLRETIINKKLDHAVIAACPARLQERRLRDACANVGVNPNHFSLMDWREGCAYVHRGNVPRATGKAIDMLNMALARVTNAAPVNGDGSAPRIQTQAATDAQTIGEVSVEIAPRVLVIGGGIAGMTAAQALAERGIDVTLVEQEAELGGQLRTIPLNGKTQAFETTRTAALHHPRIDVRLNTRVTAVNGGVGAYIIDLVRSGAAGNGAEPPSRSQIRVGAVIIATGAQEYKSPLLYRYDGKRVMTLGEFGRELARGGANGLDSAVFILCAGSRDEHLPYCSNVCCMGALEQALRCKRANPQAQVTILFRDLYLLGDDRNEELVLDARRAGVEFVRYAAAQLPRVTRDAVEVRELETGIARRIPADRVILATALVPRRDAGIVAKLFKLPRDEYGFFPDPHWRVRPEQQRERGIFTCGSAHRPVDMDTAVLQGLTAAARAARFIRQEHLTYPTSSAVVDRALCTGCAQCVETCGLGAIEMTPPDQTAQLAAGLTDRAQIDPFLCLACGNCVAACPSKAISMPAPNDAQLFGEIDAALAAREEGEGRVLVFGCHWSGSAAMELAGARRMQYSPDVRVVELPCSARLHPMHVLYALLNGADRVLLALCPPDECHFVNGNRYAERRLETLREQLAAYGIDPQRVQAVRMMGDDAEAWVNAVAAVPA